MLDPTKKDTPHARAKEKPQHDGRRGKIAFIIKPHARQRHLEDSSKTLCASGPEAPQRLTRPAFKCLSVFCGSTGLQWPVARKGALAAADLGHLACGISSLGGCCH